MNGFAKKVPGSFLWSTFYLINLNIVKVYNVNASVEQQYYNFF